MIMAGALAPKTPEAVLAKRKNVSRGMLTKRPRYAQLLWLICDRQRSAGS